MSVLLKGNLNCLGLKFSQGQKQCMELSWVKKKKLADIEPTLSTSLDNADHSH